jgi:hypothetical protein
MARLWGWDWRWFAEIGLQTRWRRNGRREWVEWWFGAIEHLTTATERWVRVARVAVIFFLLKEWAKGRRRLVLGKDGRERIPRGSKWNVRILLVRFDG